MRWNIENFLMTVAKEWKAMSKAPGRGMANKAEANKFAEKMRPILMELSLLAGAKHGSVVLARMLNERGIPTVRGGEWHPETVKRLLRRLQPEFDQELNRLKQKHSAAYFTECSVTPSDFSKGASK